MPARRRGPRAAADRERRRHRRRPRVIRAEWQGEYVRYDLIKELVIALGVIVGLAIILTILFSSPDAHSGHDPELVYGQPR